MINTVEIWLAGGGGGGRRAGSARLEGREGDEQGLLFRRIDPQVSTNEEERN